MFGEINEQVKAGRDTINRSIGELKQKVDADQMPKAGVVAGIAVAAIAFGVGLMVYRRRRRRSVARKLQSLSGSVRDLNSGLRSQLKESLEKASRAL
jgi:hypothetical protein